MKYKKGNFFSRKLSAFAGKKVFGLTSAKKYEVDANKKVLSQSTVGYLAPSQKGAKVKPGNLLAKYFYREVEN